MGGSQGPRPTWQCSACTEQSPKNKAKLAVCWLSPSLHVQGRWQQGRSPSFPPLQTLWATCPHLLPLGTSGFHGSLPGTGRSHPQAPTQIRRADLSLEQEGLAVWAVRPLLRKGSSEETLPLTVAGPQAMDLWKAHCLRYATLCPVCTGLPCVGRHRASPLPSKRRSVPHPRMATA